MKTDLELLTAAAQIGEAMPNQWPTEAIDEADQTDPILGYVDERLGDHK